jgi:DNA-binding IclR family transcriptional regulator
VLAAFMDEVALSHLIALSGVEPRARRDRFLTDLPAIGRAGYCEGPSLTITGVTNLSAPVFDYTGNAVAAVTTPFIHRLNLTESSSIPEARTALLETCRDLSLRMGSGLAVPDRSAR